MRRLRAKAGGLLVVAPHPDDEVIGAGILLADEVRRGANVRVVIVTDGARSHPGSRLWPRRRLVKERRRESRRALRRLGVGAGNVIFLDLPDGSLDGDPSTCRRLLEREIARFRNLGTIIGPSAKDAHPDHRIVAESLASCGTAARLFAYRVWPHRRQRGYGLTSAVGASASAKRSLIRLYRTQLGAICDDPSGFAIARHELDAFAYPIERVDVVRR